MDIVIYVLIFVLAYWLGQYRQARLWAETINCSSTVPLDKNGKPRLGHYLCKIETKSTEGKFGRLKVEEMLIGLRQDDMIDDRVDFFTIVTRPDRHALKYSLSWRGLVRERL